MKEKERNGEGYGTQNKDAYTIDNVEPFIHITIKALTEGGYNQKLDQ
jgi:hypothetical protein